MTNATPKRRNALHQRYLAAHKLQPQESTTLAPPPSHGHRTCLYLDTLAPPYPVLLGSAAVQAAMPTDTLPCIGISMDIVPNLADAIRRIDTDPALPLDVQCMTLRNAGLPDYQIGNCLGLDRSSVTRYIALHSASPTLRSLVRSGQLTLGHARILMRLPNAAQGELARHAAQAKLTIPKLIQTLETDGNDDAANALSTTSTAADDSDTTHIERILSVRLGAPVNLAWPASQAGRSLTIQAWGIESLCGILEAIAQQQPAAGDTTPFTLQFTGLTTDALHHLTGHLIDLE